MANLFAQAKSKGKTTTTKSDKIEVQITDKVFHSDLTRLAILNIEIARLSAESDILKDTVRERSITEFQKLYHEEGKYPGTINIISSLKNEDDASLQFISADRYIKIDEDRSEELVDMYGENIVTEETIFTMDSKLIAKHGELLSKLIEDSDIPEHEAAKLITAVTKHSIAKGTIKEITNYTSKKNTLSEITNIIEDIQPVYSIRNVKIVVA